MLFNTKSLLRSAETAPKIRQTYAITLGPKTILYPAHGAQPLRNDIAHMAASMASAAESPHQTRVLPVDVSKVGRFVFEDPTKTFLEDWGLELSQDGADAANLAEAAAHLRLRDTPVAFPTETVYGLGADARRSSAVRGIYKAKQRPSDNPLIVHISSLAQLRKLLAAQEKEPGIESPQDPIPSIYYPLISRFWPGPLTILLPLPIPSPFAPEVTTTLPTVGVRMPSSRLALALIHLADVPLAAPSANASTKPSPTTAAHVLHDLEGRIDLILDGGPCTVGVESTVVDGLTQPPEVLRPGGISIQMLRQCSGWENVRIGYKDGSKGTTPKAPGMKYKHYSPKARVLLVSGQLNADTIRQYCKGPGGAGILRTKMWGDKIVKGLGASSHGTQTNGVHAEATDSIETQPISNGSNPLPSPRIPSARHLKISVGEPPQETIDIWTIGLGSDMADIARNLFSALRELDEKGVDIIFAEAVDDSEGDAAAAVMNRLRKAAEQEIDVS